LWIQASQPGNNYVNGADLFSLYDWGSYTSGAIHGSYPAAESYQPGYYAMRIAARALVGARSTYQVTSSINNVISVVTKDSSGHYYLIACNSGSPGVTVTADLSALITTGTGTHGNLALSTMTQSWAVRRFRTGKLPSVFRKRH